MKKLLSIIFDCYQYRSRIGIFNLLKLCYYERRKIGKLISIKLKGIKSPIYARPSTSDIILIRNIFLCQEYPIFKDYFPQIIIDAGANIGLSSIYFKNAYPEAKIFAIEPERSNCELFLKNVASYSDITLIQGSLLHDCQMETKIINLDADKYSFQVEKYFTTVGTGKGEAIPSYSINQLVGKYDIGKIDILKMDIEGSEKDVFSDNLEWIAITDNIFVELHERLQDGCGAVLINAIAKHHFKIRSKGENLILSKQRETFV